MMYKMFAGDTLIYDSSLEDYTITRGDIEQEVNKAGSLVFAMPPTNPFVNQIAKLKTIIRVVKNDELIFRGRVLNYSDSFYRVRTFTCEGELAFLLDSVVRPYSFSGSPQDLFRQLIENHNSQVDSEKQFIIGRVTVEDNNDYVARSNSSATTTFNEISEKLVDNLGGYLYITYDETGHSVINWLADFSYLSRQKIEFGENLLDYVKTDSADEVATALIPYGAKIETAGTQADGEDSDIEQRVTIESVNDGKDYVYSQLGVAAFGWVFTSETWDDVTLPENLKTKAQARIDELAQSKVTIELKAVDLSAMDSTVDNFRIGDYIQIISAPHEIDERVLLRKLTRDMLNPANDGITLGYEKTSYVGSAIKNNQMMTDTITNKVTDYVVNEAVKSSENNLMTLIQQTTEAIMNTVSQVQTENDQVINEIKTVLTQLNDSFLFEFSQLETELGNAQGEYRDEFEILKKYIRFDNGNIVIGTSESTVILNLENDKLSILDDGVQTALFGSRKMKAYDGEFENALRIGNFAFLPQKNGNLSFVKIKGG